MPLLDGFHSLVPLMLLLLKECTDLPVVLSLVVFPLPQHLFFSSNPYFPLFKLLLPTNLSLSMNVLSVFLPLSQSGIWPGLICGLDSRNLLGDLSVGIMRWF